MVSGDEQTLSNNGQIDLRSNKRVADDTTELGVPRDTVAPKTCIKMAPAIEITKTKGPGPKGRFKKLHLSPLTFNGAARAQTITQTQFTPFLGLDSEMVISVPLCTYELNLLKFGQSVSNGPGDARTPKSKADSSDVCIRICARDLTYVKTLGKGAYGIVDQVIDPESRFTLAVKRITLTSTACASFTSNSTSLLTVAPAAATERKRLAMDLGINSRSRSPYVVEFYGAMLSEGDVWICMEVMDCSLDELYHTAFGMKQNFGRESSTKIDDTGPAIPEYVIRKITLSVVLALSYLRTELNVIHRDVKPSNVLLNVDTSSGGSVKMCDFGISGTLINSLAKTVDVGCQPYMAPERIDPQIVTSHAGYGYKSDVWSLGITLVEIVTGKFPYPHWKTPFDQLKSVVQDPAPRIPDYMTTISPDLRDFVSLCLTKDYNSRPGYPELLDHPFLRGHRPESLNINDFLKEILSTNLQGTEK